MSQRSITRRNALVVAAAAAAGTLAATAHDAYADEVHQLTSAEALDFLYIDNAEMYAGETQNIAVCLVGYANLESATLTVSNTAAPDEVAVPMSASSQSAMLFSFVPEYEGTYEVTRLDFVSGGASCSLDFTDSDASYRSFTTSYGVSTMALDAGSSSEEGPTLQVYTGDGSDGLMESGSIEEGAVSALSLVASPMSRAAKSGPLVIAIDPGHVGVDSGAVGVNGAQEAISNWKIAQACGGALSVYQNVKVVYTVEYGQRLNIPSGSNELKVRVQNAVNAGADVLVSIHLNSTGYGGASGAEVYVPRGDSGYNYETHSVGQELGKRIIAELEKLGLYNRGVLIRKWDEYKYPDGSSGDYYGIIRNARESNLPAIIVEHAFIDNWSDYSKFLSSDSKLAALGHADAQGIANYFGLTMAEGTVYRLYNPNSGEHHYTMDANEYITLGGLGWQQEGAGWLAPDKFESSTVVYRLYNPSSGDHHYTMDENEYKTLGRIGWKQEGEGWRSADPSSGVKVYRLFNPNVAIGTHHYTMDENEYRTLGGLGWKQEGIAWYGKASS